MSRAARLLDILQTFRRYRQPVSGEQLAREHGVSLRTLYRDIATLQSQGAAIEGAPGFGYVLKPGFMLPPMMFSDEEIEAIVLGSRWVAKRGDQALSRAAEDALAKIAAVLPNGLRDRVDASSLMIGPDTHVVRDTIEVAPIRRAIRAERKLTIGYRDEAGLSTERIIWPIGIGYFERIRLVIAWCEFRSAFRSFRTDRIETLTETEQRYPRRRAVMLKEWRANEGISG